MGSYNKYRGTYACHNDRLLNQILKSEWGFDGVVVSDWGGTHSTIEAIRNGLDLEFGSWTDGLREGASNAYDMYYMAMPYLEDFQVLCGESSVGKFFLYDNGLYIVFDVDKNDGTYMHWHPSDTEEAIKDVLLFMDGKCKE